MDKYILDTCTWIGFFHERNGVKEHVDGMDPDQIFASEITLADYSAIPLPSSPPCRSTSICEIILWQGHIREIPCASQCL